MEIMWMAVIGLVAGAVAKAIMRDRQSGGLLTTMLLGMGGALLLGLIGRFAGWYHDGEGSGLIAAAFGALALLALGAMFARRRPAGT